MKRQSTPMRLALALQALIRSALTVVALVATTAVLALVGTAHAQAAAGPIADGPIAVRPIADGPIAVGPIAVGITQWAVGDLPVTLVYPTLQPARRVAMGPFVLQVAPDAPPQPGLRRLVVMSHGTGGSTLSDHTLAATLARAGFVVAQPLHAGDNYKDASRSGPESWVTRPQEVSRIISALAADPQWGPRLQLDRVGVHGMSAGGVTALSLAGAQWRLLDMVQHCLAQAEADLGFCFNGLADPAAQAARKAAFERSRGVPVGLLPASVTAVHDGITPHAAKGQTDVRPDPRVAAITLSVPVSAIFSAESLARIRVPVGLVTAGRDLQPLPAFHSEHVLRHCTACTRLADLPGAGHMDLLSPWPAAIAQTAGALQPRGGYPEPGFDPKEREAAFEAIAQFFQRTLQPGLQSGSQPGLQSGSQSGL